MHPRQLLTTKPAVSGGRVAPPPAAPSDEASSDGATSETGSKPPRAGGALPA
jgi:hypothetical protein